MATPKEAAIHIHVEGRGNTTLCGLRLHIPRRTSLSHYPLASVSLFNYNAEDVKRATCKNCKRVFRTLRNQYIRSVRMAEARIR